MEVSAAANGAAAMQVRERFAESTSRVWLAAVAESRRLQQYYLGVEHVFLGFALATRGLLEQALHPLTVEAVVDAVREAAGTGPPPDWDRIRLTPRTKTVLALADQLCREAGRPQILPIHLLAAILLEGESLPVRVVQRMGATSEGILQSIRYDPTAGRSRAAGSILERVGRSMVEQAARGGYDPLVGRERELELLMEVLCRRTKNNPALLGEAGVGKTAIVEGLAQQIAAGRVPPALQGVRLIQVSASRLMGGPGSSAEQDVRALLEEVRRSPEVILFVDEMHILSGGAGADAAALLKPPLARGELRLIGATTTGEYRRFIEWEPALERRFQPLHVEEPDRGLTLRILQGLRTRYEQHHHVTLNDAALLACVNLSERYLHDRQQPDKAIDLMDQSAARVAIRASGASARPPAYTPGSEGLCVLPHVVTPADIASVVSDLTGVQAPLAAGSDADRMKDLESFLKERVLGQDEAVAAVAQVIRVAKRELDLRPRRPDGVVVLTGPSGVGKTSLAYAVAEFLHGDDEEALLRLDMSDYTEAHSLARLVGSPPGYVGYEEEGQLTGRVRTCPDCVLLLDEIDRAHPSVRALFMQVFEEGRLSDSRGRCIHFDHVTILLTTTAAIGAEGGSVGFRRGDAAQESQRVLQSLNEALSAEFVSRLDRVVTLKPLEQATIVAIASRMLDQLAARLCGEGKRLEVESGAPEVLASHRCNPRQGARHLARAVEELVIEPLSLLSFRPEWTDSPGAALRVREGRLVVELLPCCG